MVDDAPRSVAALLHGCTDPEVARIAAGPLAPQACRAVVASGQRLGPLLAGFARQESLLAVLDGIDELLADPAFVVRHGGLLGVAFLDGHGSTVDRRPAVAVAFLEGLLRLALCGGRRPFAVVDLMCEPRSADPGYLERLPMLLGAALDAWGGEPTFATAIRATLATLPGAGYERALDRLRQAVDAPPAALAGMLRAARESFAGVSAAEEGRLDARLHVAGIEAVLAFLDGDVAGSRRARDAVVRLADAHARLAWPGPPPAWRQPRHVAERRWEPLAVMLDRVAGHLAAQVWLDAHIALAEIREAHRLALVPVPGCGDAAGLTEAIRATVEDALRSREMLRTQVRLAAERDGDGWLTGLWDRVR